MKHITQGSLAALALLFGCTSRALAIEGLQLAVQDTNVVLTWPSQAGETYLVQYRSDLGPTTVWTTLTNYMPAATGTNFTSFTDVGAVTNVGGAPAVPATLTSTAINAPEPPQPMVVPLDGSSPPTPLKLYPAGFDFSNFRILDPATGQWVSGSSSAGAMLVQTYDSPPAPGDGSGTGFTNPPPETGFYRVVCDGVHICGLTNGMVLNDKVTTPIEFAVGNTDQVVGVSFYDGNNNPIVGASAQPFGSGPGWLLAWNTTMLANGDYDIYAELDFASNSPVVSNPVMVTISNVISFPNYFSRVFGDQMWVSAETLPDAAYQLDMYDENTNYLGSFNGSADNSGVISFLWNLQDYHGTPTDSTNIFGVFTVDTSSLSGGSASPVVMRAGAPPSFQNASPVDKPFVGNAQTSGLSGNGTTSSNAVANQLWVKEPKWTPNNNWVVAYGLFNGNAGDQQNDTYMICGGQAGEYGGVLGTLDQYGLNNNISPGNSAQAGTVFTVQDPSSRSNLLSYLADPRYENFYFFGHGNRSSIGSYNGFSLTQDQIAFALGNVPLSWTIPGPIYPDDFGFVHDATVIFNPAIQRAALHPYRFVFVDACDTGAGNFCEAFGIPAMTVSTNFFAAAGVESRAYVGFRSWVVNFNFIGWQAYSLMTGYFLSDWLLRGYNVQTCVNDAQSDVYNTGASMDSSAVIYGAEDMNISTRTRP